MEVNNKNEMNEANEIIDTSATNETNEQNEVKEQKQKKEHKGIFYTIIGILIIIIILLLLRSCGSSNNVNVDPNLPVEPTFSLTEDEDSEHGYRPTKSQEEIQAELDKKVQEGMMNISMNLTPVFENGTSEGNLLIMNEDINRHPQVIQIYRKDNDELIYQSGTIAVGNRVDSAKLKVNLEKGVYDCLAYFNSVDENTGKLLGKAGAEIKITVKN